MSETDRYSDEETARRRDEVIKRMLNTPPQPHRSKQRPKDEAKGHPPKKARSKPPS